MISGNLWNYYRDEIDDVDDNASDGKSFKYETRGGKNHKYQIDHHNKILIKVEINHLDHHNQHQLSMLKSLFHSNI